jgi:hypothetical protein
MLYVLPIAGVDYLLSDQLLGLPIIPHEEIQHPRG